MKKRIILRLISSNFSKNRERKYVFFRAQPKCDQLLSSLRPKIRRPEKNNPKLSLQRRPPRWNPSWISKPRKHGRHSTPTWSCSTAYLTSCTQCLRCETRRRVVSTKPTDVSSRSATLSSPRPATWGSISRSTPAAGPSSAPSAADSLARKATYSDMRTRYT